MAEKMTTWSDLPDMIEEEILVRLPSKSLYRFKLVCKRWLSLIQSASFINLRSSRRVICYSKDPLTETHVVSLIHPRTCETIEELKFPPFVVDGLERKDDEEYYDEHLRDYNFHRDLHIFGPVNGIYCIYHRLIERWAGTLVLWNPSTGDYKHIPGYASFPFSSRLFRWHLGRPSNGYYNEADPDSFNIGFGFDHSINDYKVVTICNWNLIYSFCRAMWHVEVFNNATNSWRTVYCRDMDDYSATKHLDGQLDEVLPYINSHPEMTNCFLHGACHWSCTKRWTRTKKSLVLAFDLAKETFKLMPGPPISGHVYEGRSLWARKETLAMVACSFKEEIVEVWMMREYGVADSWSKYCMIRVGPFDGFRVVGIPNGEQIFFGSNGAQLMSYSFDEEIIREHDVYGIYEKVEAIGRTYGDGRIFGTLGVVKLVETLAYTNPLNSPIDMQQKHKITNAKKKKNKKNNVRSQEE